MSPISYAARPIRLGRTPHQYGIFALAENVGYANAKSFAYINRMPTLAHPWLSTLGRRLD